MPSAVHSQYIRCTNPSPLIRRWIAIMLLKSHLESHVVFTGLDPMVTKGFDTSGLTTENREDAAFIREWLAAELAQCGEEPFDEADVFAVNTQRIRKSIGLNKVELAVLRFACLLACFKPLEAAAEIVGNSFTEADVCDLLAELLRLPFSLIFKALRPQGLLRQSGLLQSGSGGFGTQHLGRWLAIPEMIAREIFRPQDDGNLMINAFYRAGPKSTLTQHDFPQRQELLLLKRYLRASLRNNAVGANVLLWGPPGTGKTEMARHLAQALRKKALEINTVDAEGGALSAPNRLDCYRFCQAILAKSSNAIVVFDEVEEILSSGSFSRFGFKDEGGFTKGLLNSILETNPTPAIWITNTVRGVDPAYLRRFDVVVNVKTPPARFRKKIAWRAFRGLPMNPDVVDRLVRHDAVTPAHFSKVTKICERIGVYSPEEAGHIASQVVNGDLRALHAPPLEPRARKTEKSRVSLPYRPELINCDTDIARLAETLDAGSSVRICSFGPPGTGKTAWAKHLADAVGRPLLVKHGADILDKYIGGTEENIANAFSEARETHSVLMFDEVDGFLPDRANAVRHWEITQANQFLTALEAFDGILVCATNLLDRLDAATMRRFDFKINFEYLKPEQAVQVTEDLLAVLEAPFDPKCRMRLRHRLAGRELSYGDFAALLRRYTALKAKPDWCQVVADLEAEASFREPARRPIGFLADL